MMETEYKLKNGVKVKVGLSGAIFIVLGLFGFLVTPSDQPVLMIIAIIPSTVGLLIFSRFVSNVILTNHSIERTTFFYKRKLLIAGIKGYRMDSKRIVIEPINTSDTNIRISGYTDFINSSEILDWVSKNLTDLNKVDLEASQKEIANNVLFGFTAEERVAKADKIKQIALAYNIWGVMMCVFVVILKGTIAGIIMAFIYPLLAAVLMKLTYGLIRFLNDSSRSAYSSVFFGVTAPVFGLLFTVIDFQLISFSNGWLPAACITFTVFVPLLVTGLNKFAGFGFWQVFLMLLISGGYGVTGTISLNCVGDTSVAINYQTTVIDKYTTSGKVAHYHVTIASWRKGVDYPNIDVSNTTYNIIDKGTPVFIQEKKGWLNIPWFNSSFTPPAPAGSSNGNSLAPR